MTGPQEPRRRSLVATITWRLALVSAVIVALQVLLVTALTLRDPDELSELYVTLEAELLREGVSHTPSGFHFELPAGAGYYAGDTASAYAYRLRAASGEVIAESNATLLADVSPWSSPPIRGPDLWLRAIGAEQLHIAGGERQDVDGNDVFIEVATSGDPAGTYWRSVAHEVVEDVLTPTLPLIALLLAVSILTVRWSLQPLVDAAQTAEAMTEPAGGERFDLAAMPKEAASFALAINHLLERIGAIIEAQKHFIARAAHELRTPLAIILLELGKIADTRARRVEKDVEAMSASVDRLLALARLKALHEPQRHRVDLIALAEDVVGQMRPWATEHGHTLSLVTPATDCIVSSDYWALREALRNLVENAVKHTPVGTQVSVTLTLDLCLAVEDNGPGIAAGTADVLSSRRHGDSGAGSGLGLSIVQQAMDLTGGTLEIGRSNRGGARFAMRLAGDASAKDA